MFLKDKTAIVTGGSRGIGKAISIKLAKEGANLVINYSQNKEEAVNTENEIDGNVFIYKADISSRSMVGSMVDEAIKKFGKIDILVNNAAVVPSDDLIIDIKDSDWDRAFDVNIKGCFYCTQIVVNHMINKKINGKIINISSLCGYLGSTRRGHYSATKGAMEAFTRACAIEFAKYKINVNAVAPGSTWTDMNKSLWSKEEIERNISRIPLNRIADPEDIAGAVLYFASNLSDYITGQVLRVDGGWTSNH